MTLTDPFFSVPSNGESRDKWIEAVSAHQLFDNSSLRFYVCQLHFNLENIENIKANSFKDRIVPTIFPQLER